MRSLHDEEVPLSLSIITELLETQFPELSDQRLWILNNAGTVNVVVRLGEKYVLRLPRQRAGSSNIEREARWLPEIARHCSLRVPELHALGRPSEAYPLAWAIYYWMAGDRFDQSAALEDDNVSILSAFISQLQELPVNDAPTSGRRPLAELDTVTRDAIDSSGSSINQERVLTIWTKAQSLPAWSGIGTWRHCDLLQSNLLVRDGRLHAVLDFGAAGVGDPASDIIAAWTVFSAAQRGRFRRELDVDDETWSRARAYALHQALLIIPYYRERLPSFSRNAERTVSEVLADE